MKHILYIHQYFKTPSEPGGTRSYWISKALIDRGYQVTMLTTSDKIPSKIKKETIDGIDVVYLKVPYDQKMNLIKRLFSFLRFMFKSTMFSLRMKNIDLVIATSTPLTVGFPALIMKIIRKIPFVFEVRDLWPEVPIQMGGIKNKYVIRIVKWFEKCIYKNASHIIALSPGMSDGVISNGIKKSKVDTIPNMAKIDAFWTRDKNTSLCEKLGLKQTSFKVIHFGALGLANGAITIIESAKLIKNNPGVEFVFIGGGSTESELILESKINGLNNVHFLGKYPMAETSEIVNLCDVSIVSFLNLPILYTNSPNKLFDSLSAGKPIIVNSAGWTKELVEKNECGYYVDPTNPQDLIDKILYLKENLAILNEMGLNSRKLAESKYDKSILVNEFISIVDRVKTNNHI